jgi:hypothetical protein
VFGASVLRRIFCPRREEATGGWKTLRIKELRNLNFIKYYEDNQKEDAMGGAYSTHGAGKCIHNFIGKI